MRRAPVVSALREVPHKRRPIYTRHTRHTGHVLLTAELIGRTPGEAFHDPLLLLKELLKRVV
jgi:hypothetical protein